MKKSILMLSMAALTLIACNKTAATENVNSENTEAHTGHGADGIVDESSDPTIVALAAKTADLSTLATAVKAADLTASLANAGPFTVFAPVNAAFEKLPKGTVEDLLKPENKGKLEDILSHHTYVGVIKAEQFTDGQSLGMVDGKNISIKMVDGKPTVNGIANIIATVPAANGVVHLVDTVILPE